MRYNYTRIYTMYLVYTATRVPSVQVHDCTSMIACISPEPITIIAYECYTVVSHDAFKASKFNPVNLESSCSVLVRLVQPVSKGELGYLEKYETRVRLEIGESRIEAGRVGPKRGFWTPRVLRTLKGVKIEILDWRFEIFRIEIQSEMWHHSI